MVDVNFYECAKDALFKFAVIVSKHNGKWVFCKHKERNTYEFPGGHREQNEPIYETAKRELWEETGAIKYHLEPICVYSVKKDAEETFGMLYFADIIEFENLPPLEMEKIELFDELPTQWTYPLIQPLLLEQIIKRKFAK
ncbi:MAG: NUDIX domain-containing protein [Oscillospiraceae bacterium]|jgi:8-oxo-dGTP diphosphatase|nr:NUDIX domain-containing protein [Oscillospiraceae bacterium]